MVVRKRILIVDDNLELAENLAEILDLEGFDADTFASPRAALGALQRGRYAAAILDIRMPEMDGVELYCELKRKDPGLPAIVMTAYAQDERIRAALDEGVICVLPKPLDVARLLSRLTGVARGGSALVVEDDVALAQNLVELLTERGFTARAAHGCREARTIVSESGPFSVLLVDYRLPDGDGLKLVDELCRADDCTVVVFSGFLRDLPEGRRNLKFFEKPLDLERLLTALRPAAS